MSANPGNTGGKFKSFHSKHLVDILFSIFFYFVLAQHWERYIPVRLLPQTITLCIAAKPGGRGPSTTSPEGQREGNSKGQCLFFTKWKRNRKITSCVKGWGKEGARRMGELILVHRLKIKFPLSLFQRTFSAVVPSPHQQHTYMLSVFPAYVHPPPNCQSTKLHTCCVLILGTLRWSF